MNRFCVLNSRTGQKSKLNHVDFIHINDDMSSSSRTLCVHYRPTIPGEDVAGLRETEPGAVGTEFGLIS